MVLIKPNRNAQSLWVVGLAVLGILFGSALSMFPIPSQAADIGSSLLMASFLGLSVLWLLMPSVASWPGFLRGLAGIVVVEALAVFMTWSRCASMSSDDGIAAVTAAAVLAAILALPLCLAGWKSRRRFGWGRFYLWLSIWMAAGWSIFVVIFSIATKEVAAGLAVGLVVFGASFVMLVPYLALSAANPFFGQRFKEFFGVEPPQPMPPPLPSQNAAAQTWTQSGQSSDAPRG